MALALFFTQFDNYASYDTASLPSDTTVGNYRLFGQIGRGGMGTVYRATDKYGARGCR